MAALVYFNVSGGPCGSEGLISALGPLPGLIAVVLFPVLWAFPLSLITAELSATFPEDGGYTLWVSAAFGPFLGFQEGYWSWISGVVDNAVYPVLAMDYLLQLFTSNALGTATCDNLGNDTSPGGLTDWEAYLIKAAMATALTLLNLVGLNSVDRVLTYFTIFSLLPFIVFCVVAAPHVDPSQWVKTKGEVTISGLNGLIGLIFWNYNGFDGVSTFAGEVQDPSRSYIKGLLWALLLMSLTYLLPLLIASGLDPKACPWSEWDDGAFSVIFTHVPGIGTWLAYWLFAGAAVSSAGQFVTELVIDSYQLHGMAEQSLIPSVFMRRLQPREWRGVQWFDTPWTCILASWVIIMFLITRDFGTILDIDNFLTCLSLLLEIIAFIYLRIKQPDLERPFKIPLGTCGIIGMLAIPLCICISVMVFVVLDDVNHVEEHKALYTIAIAIVFGVLLYPALMLAKKRRWLSFVDDEACKVLDGELLEKLCPTPRLGSSAASSGPPSSAPAPLALDDQDEKQDEWANETALHGGRINQAAPTPHGRHGSAGGSALDLMSGQSHR